MNQLQIILFTIILIILIFLGAFFSCAETGLMAVNRYRLRHLARLKKGYAMRGIQLLKRPDRLLGAILIGNTFANMLSSSLATLIAFHFFGDKGALLVAIILAFLVLIFGEIAPKTLAAIYPEKVVGWVVYPIHIIMKVLSPLVLFSNSISNNVLRLFKVKIKQNSVQPLSREELRSIVYDTGGRISRQYQHMLLSILDLSKLKVEDILVPRHEISGIDIERPWDEIVKEIYEVHHDWSPVYRGNINQVIGVLYNKEILKLLLSQVSFNKELLLQLLEDPYFVPAGTSLNVQLAYFQQTQNKIAFVVDEYGEILGLLTLHDILEEIVGDFTPHLEGRRIDQQADGSYIVDGAATLREFNRQSGWSLPLRGPRTLNGLIVEYLQSLPHPGVAILISGYPIEIVQVKENRVKTARIYKRLENQ